jgi:hypothetical protein
MENIFQLLAGCRIGKNPAGELSSTQNPVGCNYVTSEHGLDLGECRLAGFHQAMRQIISINDRNMSGTQEFGTGGLAHANTSRKPNRFQRTCRTVR